MVTGHDGETTNDDLRDLLVKFMEESRADRRALWVAVRSQEEGNTVSASDLTEIKQALAWQLSLHKWVVRHKVKALIRVALAAIIMPVITQLLAALLRWLGWN